MSELTFPCDSCGAFHSAPEVSDAGGYCPQCDADYDERKMLAVAVSRCAALEAERDALRAELAALKAPAPAQDEREGFEAWHCEKFKKKWNTGHPTRDMHNGVYDDKYGPEHQQNMWEAHQAGAAWQRARPAQTEQQPVPIPGLAEAPSRVEAVIVAIRDLWDEDECPAYPVVAKALRGMLYAAPIAQTPADGLVEALERFVAHFDEYQRLADSPNENDAVANDLEWIKAVDDARALLAAHRAGGAS